LVNQFYGRVQSLGGNRYDTSSLITLLARKGASKAAPAKTQKSKTKGKSTSRLKRKGRSRRK